MSRARDAEARDVLLQKRSEIVAKVDQLGTHDPAEVATSDSASESVTPPHMPSRG